MRRIEAVTSFDALAYMNKVREELKETAAELRVPCLTFRAYGGEHCHHQRFRG